MNTPQVAHDRVVPLLQELIRNRCVNDGTPESGNEIRSADTLRRFFQSYGIESETLGPTPSRASLLVRIPGVDPMAPSLMLMGHIDVVPAESEDWQIDPFSGEIRDGHVWGRGALDMLNMTSTMAVAVAERVAENRPTQGDLYFLAVADEEASGRLGARWLVEEQWERVRTDYMVTEFGGFNMSTAEGPAVTVTLGEKGVCWVRLSVRGVPGHGSTPYRAENAVTRIAEAIRRLERYRPEIIVHPIYRQMARSVTKPGIDRILAQNAWGVDIALGRLFRARPGEAKFLHSASRMTLSPGIVSGGAKINIIPDYAEVLLDIRILPGQTVEYVQSELREALGSLAGEITIEFTEFFPSNTTELDTSLYRATEEIVADLSPGTSLVPFMIGAVTDGRYWRQRGTRVLGFTMFDREMTLSKFSSMIHGVDERVSLESLQRSLEYFYRIPDSLARAGSGEAEFTYRADTST